MVTSSLLDRVSPIQVLNTLKSKIRYSADLKQKDFWARELFKESKEKIWAVSFKEFWPKQIVSLYASILPINIGLKFQQICYKSLQKPSNNTEIV